MREKLALIGLALVLLGALVLGWRELDTDTTSSAAKRSECEVEVSFLPGASSADIAIARRAVSKNGDVESVRFVSGAEALTLMKKRYPDLMKNLNANPLGASLRITLRPGASTASVFRDLSRVIGMPRGNRLSTSTCT